MNESSGKAGKGFYPNTELGIDLKLMTKEPGRMAVGEYLDGAITHDGEDHFTWRCQPLWDELQQMGYEKTCKSFTPKQVKAIFDNLGEPG